MHGAESNKTCSITTLQHYYQLQLYSVLPSRPASIHNHSGTDRALATGGCDSTHTTHAYRQRQIRATAHQFEDTVIAPSSGEVLIVGQVPSSEIPVTKELPNLKSGTRGVASRISCPDCVHKSQNGLTDQRHETMQNTSFFVAARPRCSFQLQIKAPKSDS